MSDLPALLDELLEYNKRFVAEKAYEQYNTDSLPNKKIAILSCMDTRLTELLPAAMNLKNGDAKMIKNAGALVTHPFGSVMRSLLLAIYDLGVEDIAVIGHYDCSMKGLEPSGMLEKMQKRGIPRERLDMLKYCGINLEEWFQGFEDSHTSVRETVSRIRNHPLVPEGIRVHGFLMDPVTGRLDRVLPAGE